MKDRVIKIFLWTGYFLILNSACRPIPTTITLPVQQPIVAKIHTQEVRKKEASLLMPSDLGDSVYWMLKRPNAVYQFYLSREFSTAWQSDSSTSLADSMMLFLRSVRFYGLLPQDYHVAEIEMTNGIVSDRSHCRKEALLTDSFLSLARDLKFGRLGSTFSADQDSITLQIFQYALDNREIKQTLASRETSLEPYRLLKAELRNFLQESEPDDYQALLMGVTHDSIPLIRKIQTLEVNMERWRAESYPLNDRFVWINIPSYQLRVIEHGKTVLQSRIIVGKPETPTPVLSSIIECITLFPYWYIPRKIAIEEYLPAIQRNTSFLTLNNFDVLDRRGNVLDPADIDWETYHKNYFPVSLRQREGPDNSLGVMKFIFDNPYAVFLHDTNTKSLFRRKVRMFSHGCVRMEKAIDLAKYLVPAPRKIDKLLNLNERHTINLSSPIPIQIRYFTCEYLDGKLNFYDDPYFQDAPIIQLLYPQDQIMTFRTLSD